jgi:serine/threonine-protein kinase
MLPAVQADENAVKLFLREASVAQALKHKNVVTTYQSGSANGVFYILMDLCEGGSVDGLMEKKGGKLSLEQASWIILQILSGLDYVHNVDLTAEIRKGIFKGTMDAQGVVHRDFKPGNIFLSDHSEMPVAMVADFGMAKAFDAAGLSRITKTGTVMGTPVFMPRQQAIDFKYAKPEVDVWAAAASFYNMLTGAFPKNFRPGKNVWQIIVSEPAVPIRDRNAAIPQQLAAVIDKALREQPEIGYKSAAAFRKDIIAALPGNVKNAVKGVI